LLVGDSAARVTDIPGTGCSVQPSLFTWPAGKQSPYAVLTVGSKTFKSQTSAGEIQELA